MSKSYIFIIKNIFLCLVFLIGGVIQSQPNQKNLIKNQAFQNTRTQITFNSNYKKINIRWIKKYPQLSSKKIKKLKVIFNKLKIAKNYWMQYSDIYESEKADNFEKSYSKKSKIGIVFRKEDHDYLRVYPYINNIYKNVYANDVVLMIGEYIFSKKDSYEKCALMFSKIFSILEKKNYLSMTLMRNGKNIKTFLYYFLSGVRERPFSFYIRDKIAVLRILSFEGSSFEQRLKFIFKRFRVLKIKKMVLDLRGCRGGSVKKASFLTAFFFKRSRVFVYEKPFLIHPEINHILYDYTFLKGFYRLPFFNINGLKIFPFGGIIRPRLNYYLSSAAKNNMKFKLVVLIDKNSISCSEMVAGCLKNEKKAILIGETTYGKAIIQRKFWVNNSTLIVLPTGKWFFRNGESVINSGVQPDIFVSQRPGNTMDFAMIKAFEFLNKKDSGK